MRGQQGCSKWKQALCRRAVVRDICDAADFTVCMCQSALYLTINKFLIFEGLVATIRDVNLCPLLYGLLQINWLDNCYDYDFFFSEKEEGGTLYSWTRSAAFEPMGGCSGRICMCRQGCTWPQATHMSLVTPENMTVTLKTRHSAARSREYFTTMYGHNKQQ